MQGARRSMPVLFAWVLVLAGAAGVVYARQKGIPARVALPLLTAFLAEIALYLAVVVEGARRAVEARLRGPALAAAMTASGVVPYCMYAIPAGVFAWWALAAILALGAAVSWWYVVLPPRPWANLAFVAMVAAVLLFLPFDRLYATPEGGPRGLGVLGQYGMWTRLSILAVLSVARMEVKGFGALPVRREWREGIVNFLLFAPLGALLAWRLGFARFHPPDIGWWLIAAELAGMFLGMLWVVALREEFFFRGLVQPWLGGWLRSEAAGLLAAAALFGLCHLRFRGFPNWRMVLLAAVAGVFYGRAYRKAGSVRAAMVSHAMVNAVWRVLFW
jgi:membrane protease YdiL (CAAX protease family)